MKKCRIFIFGILILKCSFTFAQTEIEWGDKIVINDTPVLAPIEDSLLNSGPEHRRTYGSEYGRMLKLEDDTWLAAYTISKNYGYTVEEDGGFELEIVKSNDNGKSWSKIGLISDNGRDLDNAQLIQLKDGSVLLACRSVRWQESYRLPVYKSTDKGRTWTHISTIDFNEGKPNELGEPDKGVYEPHFLFLDDGRLAVMYANEKHVADSTSYSQIISQKVSNDNGNTWGEEIWAVYQKRFNSSRPGMPVWTRMKNGEYILVYEICGPQECKVYFKISEDGVIWPEGLGERIPEQVGGPYILSLTNGDLVVTSNSGNVSISEDYGASWNLTKRPWIHKKDFSKDWTQTIWSSLYQTGPNEVGIITTKQRDEGGHNIQLRLGKIKN